MTPPRRGAQRRRDQNERPLQIGWYGLAGKGDAEERGRKFLVGRKALQLLFRGNVNKQTDHRASLVQQRQDPTAAQLEHSGGRAESGGNHAAVASGKVDTVVGDERAAARDERGCEQGLSKSRFTANEQARRSDENHRSMHRFAHPISRVPVAPP